MVKLNVKAIRELMRDQARTSTNFAYAAGFSPTLLDKFLREAAAPMYYAKSMARVLGVPIIAITTA